MTVKKLAIVMFVMSVVVAGAGVAPGAHADPPACPGGYQRVTPLEAATRVATAIEGVDVRDEYDYDQVLADVLRNAEAVDQDGNDDICFRMIVHSVTNRWQVRWWMQEDNG